MDEIAGENRSSLILTYILHIIGYTLFVGTMMFAMRHLVIGVSRKIEYQLRKDLYAKLTEVDSNFYLQFRTGDIISRCTNDLNDVRTLLGPGFLYIPNSLTRFALFVPVLLGLNSRLMLIVGGLMIFLVVLIVVLLPLLRPLFQAIQEQIGKINNYVWEIATGITTIKLYNCEPAEVNNFSLLNEEYIRRQMRLVKWRGFMWPFFIFIFSIAELFILYMGGKSVILKQMTIGELLQFNVMIGYLTFPILALGWIMSLLQQGISALKRINEILEYKIPEKAIQLTDVDKKQKLVVKNLEYAFNSSGEKVLKNINLTIDLQKKQFIGITGEIGSGKSVLVQVLTALYPVPPEKIFIDDVDLHQVQEESIYPMFSMVQQQPFLFSRTVKENIIMAAGDRIDEEKIKKVIELANLEEDIQQLPEKENQLIGERGIMLSGGQRQRLAIARALYKESPVLILDDALSSVDARTEEQILMHLKELPHFRVIIFISHRISALKNADNILVMKKGEIIESGTHQELIEQNGYYSRLAKLQQLSMEEETWN